MSEYIADTKSLHLRSSAPSSRQHYQKYMMDLSARNKGRKVRVSRTKIQLRKPNSSNTRTLRVKARSVRKPVQETPIEDQTQSQPTEANQVEQVEQVEKVEKVEQTTAKNNENTNEKNIDTNTVREIDATANSAPSEVVGPVSDPVPVVPIEAEAEAGETEAEAEAETGGEVPTITPVSSETAVVSVSPRRTRRPHPIVSYCTTCFNRFWQLKKVLPHNLQILESYPEAEIVLVDFGGEDSDQIKQWLLTGYSDALASGQLKYYQRRQDLSPFIWNVSIAKNVSHRLAQGKVLVNLDGDNYLQPDDPHIVRTWFRKNPRSVFHQTWNNYLVHRHLERLGYDHLITRKRFQNRFYGSYGRISMFRQQFRNLGGYDEEMLFMGFQDTDLVARAILRGLDYQCRPPVPQHFQPMIPGDGDNQSNAPETILNQRAEPYGNNRVKSWKHAEKLNHRLSERKLSQGQLVCNRKGYSESLNNYQRIMPQN